MTNYDSTGKIRKGIGKGLDKVSYDSHQMRMAFLVTRRGYEAPSRGARRMLRVRNTKSKMTLPRPRPITSPYSGTFSCIRTRCGWRMGGVSVSQIYNNNKLYTIPLHRPTCISPTDRDPKSGPKQVRPFAGPEPTERTMY